MSINCLTSEENFRLGELVELGRRLTEKQLEKMKLLEAVIQAEKEYLWRLRSIAYLARDFSGQLTAEIEKELSLAEKFAFDPERKKPYLIGKRPKFGEKRSLPEPGTLIVIKTGSNARVSSQVFRFVVVDTPSTILLLGDEKNVIYRSVSGAAKAVTTCSLNGWRFFKKYLHHITN